MENNDNLKFWYFLVVSHHFSFIHLLGWPQSIMYNPKQAECEVSKIIPCRRKCLCCPLSTHRFMQIKSSVGQRSAAASQKLTVVSSRGNEYFSVHVHVHTVNICSTFAIWIANKGESIWALRWMHRFQQKHSAYRCRIEIGINIGVVILGDELLNWKNMNENVSNRIYLYLNLIMKIYWTIECSSLIEFNTKICSWLNKNRKYPLFFKTLTYAIFSSPPMRLCT